MEAFEVKMSRGGGVALAEACRFFVKDDPVHRTLKKITAKLEDLGIPYAVCGGMALVAHGYDRTTVDVDLLVTRQGLEAAHKQLEGLGYVPLFSGSKNLRDTETGVRVEFLITGGYPGDGKPKPVAFPDPAQASMRINDMSCLRLEKLIELKLASGMTNVLRLKDLGDVIALIQQLNLGADFAAQLHPYVRDKYQELWQAIQEDKARGEQ
ncbi:MAG: nucleotidyltransferase family protein [Planctomycetota bacterium]